mmetsp:Transcript_23729/g.73525  ORF Transcript_23729/g.73525 Transcript_23729/m.73525 type:complete len:199 (-) Transcript_23729:483-1079(-)
MGCASSSVEDAAAFRATRRLHVSPAAKQAIQRLDTDPLHAPAKWAPASAQAGESLALIYRVADDTRSNHSHGVNAIEPTAAERATKLATLRANAFFDNGEDGSPPAAPLDVPSSAPANDERVQQWLESLRREDEESCDGAKHMDDQSLYAPTPPGLLCGSAQSLYWNSPVVGNEVSVRTRSCLSSGRSVYLPSQRHAG